MPKNVDEQKAWDALSSVEDPDLKKDLVTLGMIEHLKVSEQHVSFTLVLTTPACPLRGLMQKRCEEALRHTFGKDTVVDIIFDARVTSSSPSKNVLPNVKNIIGIAAGKGGVGKSTISTNLSISLAEQGARVGLLDADIFGPSLPTLFAALGERPKVFKKEGRNMLVPLEHYGVKMMSIGFLVDAEQAVMWRGPMASTALKQLMGDTDWDALDYLIVDLPPGTSDIPITLSQNFPLTGMLIVSTPQRVAIADVRKSISMCKQPQLKIPLLGMVNNMAYFVDEERPEKKHYLFGEGDIKALAEEHDIPFLGDMPLYTQIGQGGDSGYPAVLRKGPWQNDFLSISSKLAQQVALHNARNLSSSNNIKAQ